MSITDEFREEVRESAETSRFGQVRWTKDFALLLADHIDTAFANAMSQPIENADDNVLAEHGLIRLPVDADGEPWRVGDRYIWSQDTDSSDSNIVRSMLLSSKGWLVDEVSPQRIRHKPTPAERIKKIIGEVEPSADENSIHILYSDKARELLAIADELEEGESHEA